MNIKLWAGSFLNYFYNNLLTHFPIHFIRRSFLRIFNKKIHPSSVILMHSRFLNFWDLEIDEKVVINQYCLLDCRLYTIRIGKNTDIGPYTRIWTAGHDPDSIDHAIYGGDVNIGHHVWIASGVTILPNISIADGTVVAAAAVVHKSTTVNDVVAGNPAKVIKKRNNKLQYELAFNPILE